MYCNGTPFEGQVMKIRNVTFFFNFIKFCTNEILIVNLCSFFFILKRGETIVSILYNCNYDTFFNHFFAVNRNGKEIRFQTNFYVNKVTKLLI